MSVINSNDTTGNRTRDLSAYSAVTQPTAVKGKVIPLQSWSGPEGSRKLRFLDFVTTAHVGGKVVSLKHRPLIPPGHAPGIHVS